MQLPKPSSTCWVCIDKQWYGCVKCPIAQKSSKKPRSSRHSLDYWTRTSMLDAISSRCRTTCSKPCRPSLAMELPWTRTSRAKSLSDGRDWCQGKQRRVRRYLSHSADGTLAHPSASRTTFHCRSLPGWRTSCASRSTRISFRSERTLTSRL